MTTRPSADYRTSAPRTVTRVLLGAFLAFAGLSHLFWAREEFRAQVPTWVPLDVDAVVLASGVVEVVLGILLLSGWRRTVVGWIVAAFFVAVFPGNISQYLTGTDAFGLDTDNARAIRLLFQPLLIGWALWSTGAWATWHDRARPSRAA
ncbi:hypothetical protein R4172_15170 [Rhodococcus kroppenstedtii]|uniref:DoxX family protein n=1 Tax=Rhodococcoides kroppenstedtii TaxID=293050 RepID=UPI0029551721|nr:hypothetical protein [Rhodococcus kroppenstedtii]MDV7198891.1 hypothetical protein [Rhodococcus kroppenstedtii]